MTRWVVLAVLVVGLATGAALLVPSLPTVPVGGSPQYPDVGPGPKGKAVLDSEPRFDFGTMAQQQTGEHTWVLKNEGDGNLLLTANAVCSCTTSDLPKPEEAPRILKPGESQPIKLTWHTRDFKDAWTRELTIYTRNDANREELKITISGNIQPALLVFPAERSLHFPSIPSDQATNGKIGISSPDRPDLKITSVRSTRPESVSGEVMLMTPDEMKSAGLEKGNAYKIVVDVKPSADLGVFSEEITVSTDHPLEPQMKIAVTGKRVGPVSVMPDMVRMSQVSSSDGAEQTLMITVRNAPDTKFEVVSTPENVEAKVIPTDVKVGSTANVRQYRMTVTVPPGTPPGLIGGTITLKSDHPNARQVKVPVEITVKSD